MGMKPTLQIIPNEENDGYIVIMEKTLTSQNDMYENQKEIKKFCSSEKQVFISSVERAIRAILSQFGIIPFDNTKSAIASALSALKREYKKSLTIEDRYAGIKDNVIEREELITVIQEDNVISCANEVRIIDYE